MNTTTSVHSEPEVRIHTPMPTEMEHQFISKMHLQTRHTFTLVELAYYLSNWNTINRRSNRSNLDYLRHCIRTNKFDYNSTDPVVFDENGVIISGATRMLAHLKEGKEYIAFVHFGVPETVRKIIDIGQPRTLTQSYILSQNRGVTSAENKIVSQHIAVARVLYSLENYGFSRTANRLDQLDIQDYYHKNYDIINKACFKSSDINAKNYKRAGFRAALVVYFRNCPEKAQVFTEAVNGSGANLEATSPALRCRNILDRTLSGSQHRQYLDFRRCLWLCYCDSINKPVGRKLGGLMGWPKTSKESKEALMTEEALPFIS